MKQTYFLLTTQNNTHFDDSSDTKKLPVDTPVAKLTIFDRLVFGSFRSGHIIVVGRTTNCYLFHF